MSEGRNFRGEVKTSSFTYENFPPDLIYRTSPPSFVHPQTHEWNNEVDGPSAQPKKYLSWSNISTNFERSALSKHRPYETRHLTDNRKTVRGTPSLKVWPRRFVYQSTLTEHPSQITSPPFSNINLKISRFVLHPLSLFSFFVFSSLVLFFIIE